MNFYPTMTEIIVGCELLTHKNKTYETKANSNYCHRLRRR